MIRHIIERLLVDASRPSKNQLPLISWTRLFLKALPFKRIKTKPLDSKRQEA